MARAQQVGDEKTLEPENDAGLVVYTRLAALEKEVLLAVCRRVGAAHGFGAFARAIEALTSEEDERKTPPEEEEEETAHKEAQTTNNEPQTSVRRLASTSAGVSSPSKPSKKKARKAAKPFEMWRWAQRDVALWLSYDGEAYSGFASQDGATSVAGGTSVAVDTVESRLFDALERCCLIESRHSCRYSRCGRTDRGVSALRQVVGLRLRSAARAPSSSSDAAESTVCDDDDDEGTTGGDNRARDDARATSRATRGENRADSTRAVLPAGGHPGDILLQDGHKKELDYCDMLNRVLPEDVRAVAWRSVAPDFSARFSAASRTYRYFFATSSSSAQFDVEKMRDAAKRLVGEHDFRNFCKMDVEHVKNYVRLVYDVTLFPSALSPLVYVLEITGQAFLWHMVRCIAAVLLAVARGDEAPDVVDALLDARGETPRRPQYSPAPESPLVLHDCGFDTLVPAPTPESLLKLSDHLDRRYEDALVLAAKRRNAVDHLRTSLRVRRIDLDDFLATHKTCVGGGGSSNHRASSSSSSSGNKRRETKTCTVAAAAAVDDDDAKGSSLVRWGDALVEIDAARETRRAAAYRPLLERPGAMTYDERVESMGPRKRERLESNERKRQESAPIDQAFHATKRSFG